MYGGDGGVDGTAKTLINAFFIIFCVFNQNSCNSIML